MIAIAHIHKDERAQPCKQAGTVVGPIGRARKYAALSPPLLQQGVATVVPAQSPSVERE